MFGNLHPLVQLSVLNQMESKPKLTILDTMNFWMDNTLEDLKSSNKQSRCYYYKR